MSKSLYVGINGAARRVKKIYVGINGIAHKVTKGFVGIGNAARLFFSNRVAKLTGENYVFDTGYGRDYMSQGTRMVSMASGQVGPS